MGGSEIRRAIIDRLPFGLGRAYRRGDAEPPVLFDMHFTPPEAVELVAREAGLRCAHREPDQSLVMGPKD